MFIVHSRYYLDCTVAHIVNIRKTLPGQYRVVFPYFTCYTIVSNIILSLLVHARTQYVLKGGVECQREGETRQRVAFLLTHRFSFLFFLSIYYNLILNFIPSFTSPQSFQLWRFSFLLFTFFRFSLVCFIFVATIQLFSECEFIFAISSSLYGMSIFFGYGFFTAANFISSFACYRRQKFLINIFNMKIWSYTINTFVEKPIYISRIIKTIWTKE